VANRAMFCYSWDLAEAGVAAVAEDLRAKHINTITLAGAYHAGKFIRPHGSAGKIYFPEDGTAYFKFRPKRYGAITPHANSALAERDIFAECCELPDMQVNAWMVLMHNSRLGTEHPEACVKNAFGDRYIYNLCPANPAAREYAVALCQDITDAYPVMGLSLETPGFLPFVHGYHHEFGLMQQNIWLNNILGLCFCDHCVTGAKAADIDAEDLRRRLAQAVENYLASDIDFEDDMAEAFWRADLQLDPDLHDFLNWRCRVVESLIGEIRGAVRDDAMVSVIPSVDRPSAGAWYEGSDLAGLATVADKVEVCCYEPSVARIRSDMHDVIRRVGDVGRLRAILRPGYPDLGDAAAVRQAVTALTDVGIVDIGFYNYGHLRRASLDWMGAALGGLAASS
jgi:hypothetical protein